MNYLGLKLADLSGKWQSMEEGYVPYDTLISIFIYAHMRYLEKGYAFVHLKVMENYGKLEFSSSDHRLITNSFFW